MIIIDSFNKQPSIFPGSKYKRERERVERVLDNLVTLYISYLSSCQTKTK